MDDGWAEEWALRDAAHDFLNTYGETGRRLYEGKGRPMSHSKAAHLLARLVIAHFEKQRAMSEAENELHLRSDSND